jgi:hypothetical protein
MEGMAGAGAGEGPPELQQTAQFLNRVFSDKRVSEISSRVQSLISAVGPEHSEKVAKIFSKLLESIFSLKAFLASVAVLTAPQQEVIKNLQQIMQGPGGGAGGMPQLPGGGGQSDLLKSGPLT